jgi:hypothetical protein
MSARKLAHLTVLLGISVLGTLVAAGALAQQTAQSSESGESVTVRVRNQASGDVRVYVLQGGHMVPLGLVRGGAESTLEIPPAFLRSDAAIQLVAERLGASGWYKSDPVTVRPPRALAFTVPEDVGRSSVSVVG